MSKKIILMILLTVSSTIGLLISAETGNTIEMILFSASILFVILQTNNSFSKLFVKDGEEKKLFALYLATVSFTMWTESPILGLLLVLNAAFEALAYNANYFEGLIFSIFAVSSYLIAKTGIIRTENVLATIIISAMVLILLYVIFRDRLEKKIDVYSQGENLFLFGKNAPIYFSRFYHCRDFAHTVKIIAVKDLEIVISNTETDVLTKYVIPEDQQRIISLDGNDLLAIEEIAMEKKNEQN